MNPNTPKPEMQQPNADFQHVAAELERLRADFTAAVSGATGRHDPNTKPRLHAIELRLAVLEERLAALADETAPGIQSDVDALGERVEHLENRCLAPPN